MNEGNHEPPQLCLGDQVLHRVTIPREPLVSLLVEGEMVKVGPPLQVLRSPLQRVREVVAVGVVEAGGVQHATNHRQENLILPVLSSRKKRKIRKNIL